MTKIVVRGIGFHLTLALEHHSVHRAELAFDRFRDRLTSVGMKLSDVNGPKGGVDKRCQIQAELAGLPDVHVEELAGDMYAAIDLAVEKAARALAHALDRTSS
jgi:putative sigma-54 modulation protein